MTPSVPNPTEQPPSVGLVFLAVLVLQVFLAGLVWWLWQRCESLGPPSCSFPRVSPPFSVSSALLRPVPSPLQPPLHLLQGASSLFLQESPLETSVHGLPFGAGTQQPRLQHLPKPSSALTFWPLPVRNFISLLFVDQLST